MNPATFANDLIATLDIYAAHRQSPSISPTPKIQAFARTLQSPAEISILLRDSGMAEVFDANTIFRAMALTAESFKSALSNAESNINVNQLSQVTVVSSADDPPGDAPVVCLDVTKLGNIDKAITWAKRHCDALRAAGRLLFLAIGNDGCDLSEIGKYVDGTIERPSLDSTWLERASPLWTALRTPEKVDNLPTTEVHGGISAVGFAQTLAKAARSNANPHKRG